MNIVSQKIPLKNRYNRLRYIVHQSCLLLAKCKFSKIVGVGTQNTCKTTVGNHCSSNTVQLQARILNTKSSCNSIIINHIQSSDPMSTESVKTISFVASPMPRDTASPNG